MKKLNLLEKPWHIQVAAFGLVALALYAGFWYFVTKGTRDETAGLNQQIEQLRQSNAQAQVAAQRINEFRAAYARAQADYTDLVALLPEQRELTSVLQGLQERARGSLSLRRFSPKDDFQQDFYSGKPIEVEVSGSYNRLGEFFAQMAAYQRIVSITDFRVLQASEQNSMRSVDGQFLLTAYYVPADKLQSAQQHQGAGQPANASPVTPAAPAK